MVDCMPDDLLFIIGILPKKRLFFDVGEQGGGQSVGVYINCTEVFFFLICSIHVNIWLCVSIFVCLFSLSFLSILVYCHKCFNYLMHCLFTSALSLFLFDLGAIAEFFRFRAWICWLVWVNTLACMAFNITFLLLKWRVHGWWWALGGLSIMKIVSFSETEITNILRFPVAPLPLPKKSGLKISPNPNSLGFWKNGRRAIIRNPHRNTYHHVWLTLQNAFPASAVSQ